MDLARGTCNLKVFKIIISVEFLSKDLYKLTGKIFCPPHKCRTLQSLDKLHKYCDLFIPMKHRMTENWECIEFTDIIDITKQMCN